jgi:cis-3-alkyl-4-acyloxetan-2-one decarboxylase
MTDSQPPFRLHVAIDRGQGPLYVLLHGINSTGHDWDTVVTAMGFDHRCIALDELGYGESPKPLDIDYTVDDHAEAIRYTLDELGIDEPFTLVGYSMGGPMAVRFAALYPKRVRRLLLISAPFFLHADELGDREYAKALFQTDGSKMILDLVRSARFEESGVFKKLTSEDSQAIQGFINARDLKTDWQVLQRNMANAIQNTNFAENLSLVECPVTFMVGEHDTFIVRSQIETLAERFAPNMEIRFLADLKADHMLLQNIPTVMARELLKYEDRRLSIAFDRGEGDLIILLHGIENDGSFWNPAAFALASRNRVVAFDLLGFGASPRPLDIAYSADDQIAALDETLASLLRNSEEPFTLVGHSVGAIIAAHYARLHPTRVKRLVLFSMPMNISHVAAGGRKRDKARAAFVDNFGALRERGLKLARNKSVRGVLGVDRLWRYIPSLRTLANAIEVECVADDLLAVPDIPVTAIHGTRDPFVVPEYTEELANLRPGIEVVRIDAGHDIATEKTVDTVRIIDPLVGDDLAAELAAKAAKDPKLRPSQSGWSRLFSEDNALVIFRALLYLGLGLTMLFLPPKGDVVVLRFAFAAFIFARSISFITSVFTTNSIQQERITNAASGVVGIGVGTFLMLDTGISQLILVLSAAGYLALNGLVDTFAAIRTSRESNRRGRLLWQGLGALLVALFLVLGSVFAMRLAAAVIMVTSIAAGVALLVYVGVTMRLGKVFQTQV